MTTDDTIVRRHWTSTRKPATFHQADCLEFVRELDTGSIDLIVTDPPYFLDQLDGSWNPNKIEASKNKAGVVGGLPVGMKFDRKQSKELTEFLAPRMLECFRTLKPGGFCLVFAMPRLAHAVARACEDAGFEIRDQIAWVHNGGQFKAFSLDHFIRKSFRWSNHEKQLLTDRIQGKVTPQLRPLHEPIICAMKPKRGTFVENWVENGTGLINVYEAMPPNTTPANVLQVNKERKDGFNTHPTPKPVAVCEHLIKLFSQPGQMVLDPFCGSGSVNLAAIRTDRKTIGIDTNQEYLEIAHKRIQND